MAVSNRHILSQGPVLSALGWSALGALRQKLGSGTGEPLQVPGRTIERSVAPLPRDLVRDYVRHVGGDPSAYRASVPAHLFPQWSFPLAARTLEGVPYPLLRVMNGGCRMVVNAPLAADDELTVKGRLESIDDNGRRAVLQQRVTTATASHPTAIVADFYAIVPLGKSTGSKSVDKPRVPSDAKEIARWRLGADAGLEFAKLTGDFNPIHWVPSYAKAYGFRNVILHGFSTMARAVEGLNRGLFAGRVDAIHEIDVRFTRPLVLPALVGLYVVDNQVFVGDAPSGPAYLTGTYLTQPTGEPS